MFYADRPRLNILTKIASLQLLLLNQNFALINRHSLTGSRSTIQHQLLLPGPPPMANPRDTRQGLLAHLRILTILGALLASAISLPDPARLTPAPRPKRQSPCR